MVPGAVVQALCQNLSLFIFLCPWSVICLEVSCLSFSELTLAYITACFFFVSILIFELKEYIERVYPLAVTDFFEYTHEMNTLMAHGQH